MAFAGGVRGGRGGDRGRGAPRGRGGGRGEIDHGIRTVTATLVSGKRNNENLH